MGSVRDAETGEPVVGAHVTYLGELSGAAESSESAEAALRSGPVSVTGQDGGFRIENVPCGSARLRVELAGYWAETVKGVELLGETTSDIAVTLLRTDADRVPLHGVVRDEAGAPLEDVSVACGAERAQTRTDGLYRIPVPRTAEGSTVTYSRPGYQPATETIDAWSRTKPIAHDVTLLRLRSGRIVGVALDAHDGAPLQGVRVELEDRTARSVTDSAGVFRLDDVPLGETVVVFTASGYRAERRTVSVDGEARLHVPLVAPSAGGITAVARDARTGAALSDVQVATEPLGRTGVTDVSGTARLEHVPAGRYTVRFYLRNFGQASVDGVTVTDLDWPEAAADLEPVWAGLEGAITTPDGAPAPGWSVLVRELGGPDLATVFTDALGRFEAHDIAVTGASRTVVVLPNEASTAARVTLTPGRTTDSGPLTLAP